MGPATLMTDHYGHGQLNVVLSSFEHLQCSFRVPQACVHPTSIIYWNRTKWREYLCIYIPKHELPKIARILHTHFISHLLITWVLGMNSEKDGLRPTFCSDFFVSCIFVLTPHNHWHVLFSLWSVPDSTHRFASGLEPPHYLQQFSGFEYSNNL